jgi:lysophospholipase L1-like esterase
MLVSVLSATGWRWSASLNQGDGIHPNKDGVAEIINRMMPRVEALLDEVRAARADS